MNEYINPDIAERFDELVREGEQLWSELLKQKSGRIDEPVRFTQWTTSCLNLLDKLSIGTNRFAKEFESWASRSANNTPNIGAALSVLKAARDDYNRGFAIDYQLSVASAVFGDLLQQANYLFERGYLRAAVVLAGAALEEALRSRAKTMNITLTEKDTLIPMIHKLKSPEVGIITEFHSRQLEAIAKIRNDAAHGKGDFSYSKDDVERTLSDIESVIGRLLGER